MKHFAVFLIPLFLATNGFSAKSPPLNTSNLPVVAKGCPVVLTRKMIFNLIKKNGQDFDLIKKNGKDVGKYNYKLSAPVISRYRGIKLRDKIKFYRSSLIKSRQNLCKYRVLDENGKAYKGWSNITNVQMVVTKIVKKKEKQSGHK